MEFEHELHEEVYHEVNGHLRDLFAEDLVRDALSGHFYVDYGTTVIEISVDPYGPEEVFIMIMAHCVRGARVDDELMRGLLGLNHSLPFGSFSVMENDIFYQYALFGSTLEPKNLLNAVASVATIADDYDDKIAAKYGGQRAFELIPKSGGRRQREEIAGETGEFPLDVE